MAKKNKEALILEVHKRPLLWKEKMKNYKNKSFTDPLWQEVGAATKMSGKYITVENGSVTWGYFECKG